MRSTKAVFKDQDLLFLLSVLMPSVEDKQRMLRILREDEEILEGMIADEKVFHRLLADPWSVIAVSPALFFAILLARVASDLTREPYTFERSMGFTMPLFDTPQIVTLLENRDLRTYLTELLVSFVRINSFSTSVRVRRGTWRRVRFSDFDIDHLLRYSTEIDESRRFPVYRRIADICLFTLGVFSPSEPAGAPLAFLQAGAMLKPGRTRDDYIEQGTSFYSLASRHREAEARSLTDVLSTLAEKITLAAKPLSVMSARYLQPFKEPPATPPVS
jgi:hypothetical protein